jgi:hypothetical protein
MFAFETPRQEMQEGLFAHIQMPDAPMLFLDELSLKASHSVYKRQSPRDEP